jgi:5-hydroxyisourate hydrolase
VSLSTHVLDTARGEPAAGVPVRLDRRDGTGDTAWITVASGHTDQDGRLRVVPRDAWGEGVYRLVFDTAAHLGPDAFFPEVTVAFRVTDAERHLHVPLLLSPFGFTTYRGS